MSIQDELLGVQMDTAIDMRKRGKLPKFMSGDADVDAALDGGSGTMTATPESVDTVVIYDTSTNEPREVLVNMLRKTMQKRRGNKPAFSITPLGEYVQGHVMCYLHPDHPDRKWLASVGVTKLCETVLPDGTTVSAGNLASEYDRDLHMQHKHRREWAVIKEARERQEREADRELRREEVAAMREAMAAMASNVAKKGA